MKKVEIHTDGACSGNPGKGGWAAILVYKGIEKVISDGYPNTTNNRMELFAILSGLMQLKEKCDVTVYSDSAYALNPFLKGWIEKWRKNDWKKTKNTDIWKALYDMVQKHKVTFVKVKGHSDNEYNNRCDKLAKEEINKLP
ncbi:MAG: ribonuclease HI [Christensenellales bacterium]